MRIYQRFLYVGLGGTGLRIGAQLEQALRLELAGADGRALITNPAFAAPLAPFELPKFLQFVYADFDERERRAVEAGSEKLTRLAAVRNTTSFISNLTPHQNNYADVADSLRTSSFPIVETWLPPVHNEPQVAPLQDGAGQYPTVGRAALYETIRRQQLEVVMEPLREAVKKLANAGGDLTGYLGKPPPGGCDVFVGFSVAGGTGAGLFYDFLRLISWEVSKVFGDAGDQSVHIYPLVVLPSAFSLKKGGGRPAELNGAPALRELFSLVDQCNTGGDVPALEYPGDTLPTVPASSWERAGARTAFLFGQPRAITQSDLHRSIVAFVLSLIGTELDSDSSEGGSFASDFVNKAGHRRTPAPDGVGCRPAATALAAQLTIPSDDIADILSSRLVAQAVGQLNVPRSNESNRTEINGFLAATGLTPLQTREPTDALPAATTPKGAAEIHAALTQRRDDAVAYVKRFSSKVDADTAKLAERFSFVEGVRALAPRYDLLRVSRIVLGDQRLVDEPNAAAPINRDGVIGFIQRRSVPFPSPNSTFQPASPPAPPPLRNTFIGMRKAKAADEAPTEAIALQDDWYSWRIKAEWHNAWAKHKTYWQPKLDAMRKALTEVRAVFEDHLSTEEVRFEEDCRRLYGGGDSVVVYFLPEGGAANDLALFYDSNVLPRLRERLKLTEGADAGSVLNEILGEEWLDTFRVAQQASPEAALEFVLTKVAGEILAVLTEDSPTGHPLLPRLSTLLAAAAAADGEQAGLPAALLARFESSVGALLPVGFQPEGTQQLKVEVFYPAAGPSAQTETFLRARLGQYGSIASFHQIADSNFLGVVLTRVGLWATDVKEFRDLMRIWADAVESPRLEDYLPWRQRLGFDSRWTLLSESDRIQVTLRLLNAMWDDAIDVVAGTMESPERIQIRQPDAPQAPPIDLTLRPYGKLSRWTTILQAYERYALGADPTTTQRCEQFMKRLTPERIDAPRPPAEMYRRFREITDAQAAEARGIYKTVSDAARGQALQAMEFWTETVPCAIEQELQGGGGPQGRNHHELYESFHAPPIA
jgi:hypothetical protein